MISKKNGRKPPILFVVISIWIGQAAAQRPPDEWQLLYNHCQYEFEQHCGMMGSDDFDCARPFVKSLELFAGDRDRAKEYAQEALSEGNEYFANQFLNLMQRAMEAGDSRTRDAHQCYPIRDNGEKLYWGDLCLNWNPDAPRVYEAAKRFQFHPSIVRDDMRENVAEALRQWIEGWGYLPSDFWPLPGDLPNPQVAVMLDRAECVRDMANYFDLAAEYERATDTMTRYFEDALCFTNEGHQWYIDRAVEHDLKKAKEYAEGFYATVYGKVELKTPAGRRPADGAQVVITDPHDGRKWTARTDGGGNYEIKGAILHSNCSPFDIRAEYHGDEVVDLYFGPLDDPDPGTRYKQNLVIERSGKEVWTGRLTIDSAVRFDCEAVNEEKYSSYKLSHHKLSRQHASLKLKVEDTTFTEEPLDVLNETDLNVSGRLSWTVKESEETLYQSKYASCDNRQVTPGDASQKTRIWRGGNTFPVSTGLSASFERADMPSAAELQALLNELQQNVHNPERTKELNTRLDDLLNPDRNEPSFPVKIHLLLGVDCSLKVTSEDKWKEFKRCAPARKPEESSGTFQMEGVALSIDLSGTYKRVRNGRDRITARLTRRINGTNEEAGVWECPESYQILNASLVLTRRPERQSRH